MTDEQPREMGLLGQYTGLDDKDGNPLRIGHVIRMDGLEDGDEPTYAFGRVWYMAPELCARRVDETTGELLEGSYSLIDWGHGVRIDEFTLMPGHPGARWPVKEATNEA